MVKLPGLGDLKKIGSDLIDSAKSVNLSGMVDKFKTGTPTQVAPGDDPLKNLLQDASTTLNELTQAHAVEASLIKKMQAQLAEIARVANTYQKPIAEPQQEDDKK